MRDQVIIVQGEDYGFCERFRISFDSFKYLMTHVAPYLDEGIKKWKWAFKGNPDWMFKLQKDDVCCLENLMNKMKIDITEGSSDEGYFEYSDEYDGAMLV